MKDTMFNNPIPYDDLYYTDEEKLEFMKNEINEILGDAGPDFFRKVILECFSRQYVVENANLIWDRGNKSDSTEKDPCIGFDIELQLRKIKRGTPRRSEKE